MTVIDIDQHKFNDDLLTNPGDLGRARILYPGLFHVLDHPELRNLFLDYDKPANAEKARSRKWGYTALALGLFALMTAAAYPLYENRCVASPLGFIAAFCGVSSLIIGYSEVLFGKAKRRWLYQRLMTERLRQFHFQTLIRHLPEVLDSIKKESKADYEKLRDKWFTGFKVGHEDKLAGKFSELMGGEGQVWLHDQKPIKDEVFQDPDLDLVFQAYQALRLDHQLGYANYVLREGGWRKMPVARQASIVSMSTFLAIIIIFVIHLVIAIAIPFHWEIAHSKGMHMTAMWAALIGLAIRGLSEGWRPEEELGRYRWYKSSIENLRARFTQQQTPPKERLRIMGEMEQLAFEEMREFLRANNKSRFVI